MKSLLKNPILRQKGWIKRKTLTVLIRGLVPLCKYHELIWSNWFICRNSAVNKSAKMNQVPTRMAIKTCFSCVFPNDKNVTITTDLFMVSIASSAICINLSRWSQYNSYARLYMQVSNWHIVTHINSLHTCWYKYFPVQYDLNERKYKEIHGL